MKHVNEMSKEEVVAFAVELIEHLDYCGWGDRWERECSEELRAQAAEFEKQAQEK